MSSHTSLPNVCPHDDTETETVYDRTYDCIIDWLAAYERQRTEQQTPSCDDSDSTAPAMSLEELSRQIEDVSMSDRDFAQVISDALVYFEFEPRGKFSVAAAAFCDSFQLDGMLATIAMDLADARLNQEDCEDRLEESETREDRIELKTELTRLQAETDGWYKSLDILSDIAYQRTESNIQPEIILQPPAEGEAR